MDTCNNKKIIIAKCTYIVPTYTELKGTWKRHSKQINSSQIISNDTNYKSYSLPVTDPIATPLNTEEKY